MSKLTLIEIVQDILNDISGDYVATILDTEESEQVANLVKSTYLSLISNRNWPHTKRVLNLTAASNSERPTHMSVEDDLKELVSIYYDKNITVGGSKTYLPVKYMESDDFLRFVNQRNSTATTTKIVSDPSGVELLIANNKAPDYYTSFNDEDIVFDSYHAVTDTTIQSSKTQAIGYVIPAFELSDVFVPDLPLEAFSLLVEESKSRCSLKLRQVPDEKAEQVSGRQNRWLSRKAWKVNDVDIYPYSFGRKSRK